MREVAYGKIRMNFMAASSKGPEVGSAVELLKALGNPIRLSIVVSLLKGPRCVHDLTDELALPQPLVSQHLAVLRTSTLISARRVGRENSYSIADDHVERIARAALDHAQEKK